VTATVFSIEGVLVMTGLEGRRLVEDVGLERVLV
jgi:hypothetical protein